MAANNKSFLFHSAVEKGLKYAESHEWAKITGDTATVGISDFAQVRPTQLPFAPCANIRDTNVLLYNRRASWAMSCTLSSRRLVPL